MNDAPERLRVALIGCGLIGRVHAERLRSDERVEIVCCCDPNRAAAEAVRDEHAASAHVTNDVIEAFSQAGLSAAVLCSPTPMHYDHVCQAFDRGLDVLCEKPLATRREEIVKLIDRAARERRLLALSYQRRYDPLYATLRRELIDRGDDCGPLKEVHVFFCERWHQTIAGTWRDDLAVSFGHFGDAGSHHLDALHYVTGRAIEEVFATSDRRGANVEIVTRVLGRMTGGVGLMTHFVGDANHWREDLHFHCRDADLLIRDRKLWRARENRVEPVTDLEPASTPDRVFVDAVLGGTATRSPAECALPVFDCTQAVVRSIASGRWENVGSGSRAERDRL